MQTFLEFQSLLTDSLDSPLPYRWGVQTSTRWAGQFQLPTNLAVNQTYQCDISILHHDEWIVRFGVSDGGPGPLKFDIIGKTQHEFRVFATVIAMVKDFVRVKKPTVVRFSAKEPSRRALYRRFMSRVPQVLPGYHGTVSAVDRRFPSRRTYDAEYAITRTTP